MTYLKRKIDDYLSQWKDDPEHLPLIVRGPRQVGKTESILCFAKDNYQSVIYVNFVERPDFKMITRDGYSVESIVRSMSLLDTTMSFEAHKTLIFFDEVQDFPEIATALKFFKIDGRFDVICSGSMLGVYYAAIQSVSVGYKTDYTMRSMDFEEFLWAVGRDDAFVSDILGQIIQMRPLGELMLGVLNRAYLDFCVLGGMPAVVRGYVERGTFEKSLELQRQLLADYREDARKYAQGLDQARIINVFDHIPIQLAKENKKFQLSKIENGARYKDYRGCVEWLADAGIVNVCYCLDSATLPLKGNYDERKYKLYCADTGLLVSMLDEEAQLDLRSHDNLGVYRGGLAENAAGEALVKQGYRLYYYKRENSTLEEDFFVRKGDDLVPVEIKATNNRTKSLNTLIASDMYPEVRYGIKFAEADAGYAGGKFTLPRSCTFLFRRWLQAVDIERHLAS